MRYIDLVRNIIPVILVLLLVILTAIFLSRENVNLDPGQAPLSPSLQTTNNAKEDIKVIAQNLDTPWSIAFLPDKSFLVTERPGRVSLVTAEGKLDPTPVTTIEEVQEAGEGGLLGTAVHPDFSANHYVYFYYTYSESGGNTLNRVVRMRFEDNKLSDQEIIVNEIPGASNHNGGRIKFGPDGYLYITTGDAQNPSLAQDTDSLAGKILRVTDTGQNPSGNPFNNTIYSYGHRNPQGLAWDDSGRLWSTEHGSSNRDEINLIKSGQNYGWPEIQGDESRDDLVGPVANSGNNTTWAPAGAVFVNKSLFFGGLRGQALYEAVIEDNQVKEIKEHFKGEFGRIRDVVVDPGNFLYVSTSNRDGRTNPGASDDKIIRINPNSLQ
ncbi:PQQ-dependent sugar dehydrogenase [Candidatus Parcubacteria bacterium]|nr:MAG: PQQ-dependent sugar dehydrogenase [Candidatus Parcubacteria bacterium]